MSNHRPELQTKRWRTLRLLILERDNWVCYLCHKKANQVDHIIPPWAGGNDEPSNLAAACGPCNNSKHHRYVDVPVLTIRW